MKTNIKEITEIIKKYKNKKSALLEILQDIQRKYKCLPPEALKFVSKKLGVSMTDINGITTFYRMSSSTPQGKHTITVCNCASCHINGSQVIIDRIQERLKIEPESTSPGGQFTFKISKGLGVCSLGPVVVVDGQYYRKCTKAKIDSILDGLQDKYQRKASRKVLDEVQITEPESLITQK
jgi:NADH-quinone oxidoreductase subunit E